MPTLTLKFEEEVLKTYQSDESVITIGRLPENTVSIVNMGISRRHARIEREPDGNYAITDLNSLNGTYVNDKRITKAVLRSGDKIIIGKYTIVFEVSTPTGTDSTPPSTPKPAPPALASDTLQLTTPTAAPSPSTTAATASESAKTAGNINESLNVGLPVLIETNKHVVYKIDKNVITLGNAENDDIFIDGLFIDESHACIERRSDGFWLTSKKLFGKVKVNGKKVKDHKLEHKDRIEIGSSTLRFMENG